MARTEILHRIQLLFHELRIAERAGVSLAAMRERAAEREERRAEERGHTRREVLVHGAALGGLAAACSLPRIGAFRAPRAVQPSIAIVGGGLAGLTAALRLRQAGLHATIFEAATRVGGRVHTDRKTFAAGQRVERGGELIDTHHKAYRGLIHELGFTLDDLHHAEPKGTEPFYFFDNEPYTYAQAEEDFAGLFHTLKADAKAASYPTLFDAFTPGGAALDQMSISQWIDSRVPGGLGSRLGQLLDVAYDIEYGAPASLQSSLNLIYLLAYGSSPGNFRIFGQSDERYRVKGGNDAVTSALGELLADQIELEHRLVAASTLAGGATRLVFATPGGAREVTAERVVLTVPFAVLRAAVDLTGLELSPLKATAIAEIGMGTNAKLHVQFQARPWHALGSNGETFADTGYQTTWEETRAQPGTEGILVDYRGSASASLASGTPQEHAAAFLKAIDPVLPEIGAQANGLASVDYWPASPYQLGSYAFWKVGQYTKFAGIEGRPEGAVHFAGEHTSVDFQGYMQGAVETGERAAAEILEAL